MEDYEGIFAIVFSLSIPIVAIVCAAITSIRRKSHETELRKAIIENHIDAESIKLLIEEPKKKETDKYGNLRGGLMLLGLGLGALFNNLVGASYKHNIEAWLVIACGIGIGLLTSFIIEYKLTAKEKAKLADEQAGDMLGNPRMS